MKKFALALLAALLLLATPAAAQVIPDADEVVLDVNAVLVEYHDARPFSYPDVSGLYFFLGTLDVGTWSAELTFSGFALRHCVELPFGLPPDFDFDSCLMYRPRPYGPETYELVAMGDHYFAKVDGSAVTLTQIGDATFELLIESGASFWRYEINYGTPDIWAPRRPGGKRVRR
jgi:hypothetical protein